MRSIDSERRAKNNKMFNQAGTSKHKNRSAISHKWHKKTTEINKRQSSISYFPIVRCCPLW